MALEWYGQDVLLKIEEATAAGLFVIAQRTVDEAKLNITRNGQVDTGFMRESGYAVGETADTYSPRRVEGRVAAPMAELESGQQGPQAIAGFAAEYTLYEEARMPFLYPAVETVKRQAPQILQATIDD